MKKLKRMNELCNTLPWFVGWDGSCFSINKGDGEASFLWFFYSYICVDIYTIAMLMSFENLIKSDLRFLKKEDLWFEDEWMKIKHQDQKRGFCFASFKYKKENDKN